MHYHSKAVRWLLYLDMKTVKKQPVDKIPDPRQSVILFVFDILLYYLQLSSN